MTNYQQTFLYISVLYIYTLKVRQAFLRLKVVL